MVDSTSSDFIVSPEVIKGSPLGGELSDAQCRRLAEVVTACGLKQGEFLFEEGRKDDSVHIITSGHLDVVKATGGEALVSLHVLHPGDMVGELGFVDGIEHSAGVRALSNCEVFTLHRNDLESLIQEDPQLVYKVMRAIIRTVHAILRRMNLQYVEMSNYITHQHGRY